MVTLNKHAVLLVLVAFLTWVVVANWEPYTNVLGHSVRGWDYLSEDKQNAALGIIGDWNADGGRPLSITFERMGHAEFQGERWESSLIIYEAHEMPTTWFRCVLQHELWEPMEGVGHNATYVIHECIDRGYYYNTDNCTMLELGVWVCAERWAWLDE